MPIQYFQKLNNELIHLDFITANDYTSPGNFIILSDEYHGIFRIIRNFGIFRTFVIFGIFLIHSKFLNFLNFLNISNSFKFLEFLE